MLTFEPKGVRGGTIPSVVGDEWNLASERRSIQPRVLLKAAVIQAEWEQGGKNGMGGFCALQPFAGGGLVLRV